ncbi:MAG: XRE family transcriptional regulator [Actinocatenispora sp.]
MSSEPVRPLAANLRRLRTAAGLSVVELARRSGISRATLTQLETAGGNPTLETLYALANNLGMPLADLIADATPTHPTRILRQGDGPHAGGSVVDAWLLHQSRTGDMSVEIYALTMRGGATQLSEPHPPGTREHLHLHSGRVRVGPADDPVELDAGDYVDHAADVPHLYQRLTAKPVSATLVISAPR